MRTLLPRLIRILSLASMLLVMALSAAQAQRRKERSQPGPGPSDRKDKDEQGNKGPSEFGDDDESKYSCIKKKGRFKVNLANEVELKDLITWAMTFRCENFIYGTGVGGRNTKVIMVTPKTMSAGQAWRLFLVSLQNMNLTVVRKGNTLEIIEAPQAKRSPLPVYQHGTPSTDQIVRAVIRPEHLPANELSNVFNELKSRNGEVRTIANANIIVVTDFGSHIARMRQVARAVDRPVLGERLYYIKIRHADATEIASKLTELLGTKTAVKSSRTRSSKRNRRRNKQDTSSTTPKDVETALPSKITADERTNSLIVLASKAAYVRVRGLVKRLDVPIQVQGQGRIHVYVLQHADAEEMAQTLTSAISGIQPATNPRGRQNTRRSGTTRRSSSANRSSTGAEAFEGQVRVTHDQPSNALIVVASPRDFLSLTKVIERLDTPRPQVYIEAHIVEINISNSRNVGFSYHGGLDASNGAIILGGLQSSDLSSLAVGSDASRLVSVTGLLGGALGPLLPEAEDLLGVSIPSFGVLFQALASSSDVNVLSSPHIMTTDNQEAEISVGENIPYQAGLATLGAGAAGLGLGQQNIQRQNVALTLKVTPQINASDNIRLDINLEVSDIASRDFEGLGPSWSQRSIKDTVVVSDQESVVIGGLIRERLSDSETKIPLLGDIPLLGYLFRYTRKSKAKTNLLVMLTPHVVKDTADMARIRERRMRDTREFSRLFSGLNELEEKKDFDYRRKNGLLQEINHILQKIDEETRLRRELDQKLIEFPDGPINYEKDTDEEGNNGTTLQDGKNATPPPISNASPLVQEKQR